MKRVLARAEVVFWFTVIWVILHEGAGWVQVASGVGFSLLTLLVSERFFLRGDYRTTYRMQAPVLFHYGAWLLLQIYRSGFTAIRRIIRGQTRVVIEEYATELEDDYRICLLANAVTLTPGTVTVDKVGRTLKILSFQPEPGETDGGLEEVCGRFEQILRGKETT